MIGLANHTVLITRDGKELAIADSGAPVRSEDGNLMGVVLVFREQTAERAAQKALRKSEERLRQFFDYEPGDPSCGLPGRRHHGCEPFRAGGARIRRE